MKIEKRKVYDIEMDEKELNLICMILKDWTHKNQQEAELCNDIGVLLRQIEYVKNK